MHRSLVLLGMLACGLAWPSAGAAQVGGARNHIGAGMAVDFGGEVDLDRNALGGGWDDDLDATIGLRGHWDHAVHRHVSIGGLLRMSWWEPDYLGNIDRSFLLDPCFRVIGHYDWRQFRFYGGLAPGLTLSVLDDEAYGVNSAAVGFTMSLTLAGFEWWFARRVGLFAELGWVGHWFEHNGDGPNRDLEIGLSQGLFEFGFVFGV